MGGPAVSAPSTGPGVGAFGPPPNPPSPPSPPGPGAPPGGAGRFALSRRTLRLLVLLLSIVLVGAVGARIHPPYVLFRAGPVYDTLGAIDGKPVIEVNGAPTYDATGNLAFTTVAVYGGREREITLWEYLLAHVQPDTEIRPIDEVYRPDVTREQIQEQNKAQMADAQAEAKVVALRATGRTVPETVSISAVLKGGPAEGVLRKGDRLVTVDNAAVTSAEVLRGAIRAAGDRPVALVVRRDGADVPLQVRSIEQDGRRMIGVGLAIDFAFPVEVSINAGDIGGPSAGLMFSLGVYDRLTPGSLTGGAKIAGTGTIADDGSVGPIGGIDHKMRGARSAEGSDWFLAPADNCGDVRGKVPDGLHVVKVASFDQARQAVEAIAGGRGDSLATCG